MIKLEGHDEDLFFLYMGMLLGAISNSPDLVRSIIDYVNKVGVQSPDFVPYEIKK